jgi:hypothetical protein
MQERTWRRTRPGGSAIDARTTRHEGYAASLEIRKLIETRIGWVKEIGGLRKVKLRGLAPVNWKLLLSLTAFNLLHLRNVLAGIEAAARRLPEPPLWGSCLLKGGKTDQERCKKRPQDREPGLPDTSTSFESKQSIKEPGFSAAC